MNHSNMKSFKLAITKGDCTSNNVDEYERNIFSVRIAMTTLILKRVVNDKNYLDAYSISRVGKAVSSLKLSRILGSIVS